MGTGSRKYEGNLQKESHFFAYLRQYSNLTAKVFIFKSKNEKEIEFIRFMMK